MSALRHSYDQTIQMRIKARSKKSGELRARAGRYYNREGGPRMRILALQRRKGSADFAVVCTSQTFDELIISREDTAQ